MELLRAYPSKTADDSFSAIYSGHCLRSLRNARLSIVPHAPFLLWVFNLRAKRLLRPSALWLLLRAKAKQRSNDDFLHLLRDLGVVSDFRPQNLRRQITRAESTSN
jgi:hypothetical protein